ncbi:MULTISPECIES: FAD-binding protein [unclassified Legionella]|uniref:FAD-binding protein n=1 Tax=unclassified Legionella TaxID=2622702 RepID=UPI001054377D|nr:MULTISPECIES: FAD-binding protein [unclassified Legionella]MDI9819663.1 FAD-binding protein [Legionella sp. PL877]
MKINFFPGLAKLTAIPAVMIDNAYRNEEKGVWGHVWRALKVRTIYGFVFLPLALVDLGVAGLLSVRYAIGSALRVDDVQDQRLMQQKKYNTLFSKNLLVLVSAPLGFLNPKLAGNYFLPERSETGVISGGSYYYHSPNAELKVPGDVEELQSIIANAARRGDKIIPVGAGFSQGKQFLREENITVVDLKKFNTIEINSKEKTATVGAGTRWKELQVEADKHKLALQVMQASNVFSVGGSIGTNIHGWKHDKGMLSNVILSMDIINAQGEKQTLTPRDELFHAVTGGLGLVAIVVSVTIQLTDNELLMEKGVKIPISDYVDYFYQHVLADEKNRMHLFRLSLDPKNLLGSGVAVNYVKEGTEKPCITPNLTVERADGKREERILINLARRFDWLRKFYWAGESGRLLANKAKPLTTNAIMQPPISAMFTPALSEAEWLQEYFLPAENLAPFLSKLGKLLTDNHVVLLNASVRFVKQNNKSPLSYAYDGDRFAVVLCFNQSLQQEKVVQAQKWLREAQKMTVEMGGAYYLPYQHVSSPEDFDKAYPHAEAFRRIKATVDPDNLFVSGFYQKYIAPQPQENHFKVIMKDEASRKEFAGFLRNVLQRVDDNKLYDLLADILKYKDSHAEIYEELCRRLPEVMPSQAGSVYRILNSLSAIKKDLADQAKLLLAGIKEINGLVEIGYPGRFVAGFKNQFEIRGKIIAVLDAVSMTDYIQTGFPTPYHQFQKLDYSKPNLADLPDNSADVITCYVGLHHFPDNELETFLKDVRRVLRNGGHFLLVDHDVVDEKSFSMAYMAHTIFNAVTGISLQDEVNETRNFHPMSYWQELLEKHGLGYAIEGPDVPLIRTEDPSRNRMVSFVKSGPENACSSREHGVAKKSQRPDWRKSTAVKSSHSSLFEGNKAVQVAQEEERITVNYE